MLCSITRQKPSSAIPKFTKLEPFVKNETWSTNARIARQQSAPCTVVHVDLPERQSVGRYVTFPPSLTHDPRHPELASVRVGIIITPLQLRGNEPIRPQSKLLQQASKHANKQTTPLPRTRLPACSRFSTPCTCSDFTRGTYYYGFPQKTATSLEHMAAHQTVRASLLGLLSAASTGSSRGARTRVEAASSPVCEERVGSR